MAGNSRRAWPKLALVRLRSLWPMPFYERLAYQNERFLRHGRARKDSGRTRQEMKPVRSSLLPGTSEHDIYYCDYRLEVAPESVGRAAPRAREEVTAGVEPQCILSRSSWGFSTRACHSLIRLVPFDQAPAAVAHGLGIGAADRMTA